MAGNNDGQAETKKDGEDLTTILDESQRGNLTLLIADITGSMRKLILDNFNATAGLDPSLVRREDMTEDEKLMSADVKMDPDQYEKQKKLRAESEKDLDTQKMKNLKKNSLKAYDDWREQVMLRVGQVVNTEKQAKTQLKESKSNKAKPNAPQTVGKIKEVPKNGTSLKFRDLFPPTKTALTKLSMDKRTLILHSLLLLLLSLEHYNAASRILLLNLTSSLKLPLRTFEQDEYVTAKGLLENAKELSASEETKKHAEENQDARQKKVRYAAIAGAAVLGVAGSFAAPLLAAGIGSVASGLGLGTTAAAGYLGSVASSSLLVGSLFGAYGGRMTGQMMDQYARDIEDFEFMPVHSNQRTSEDPKKGAEEASAHDHKLRVTICLSGWLREKAEVIKPWRVIGSGAEVFALKYELEALLNLGNSMDGMVSSAAWGYAQRELIQQTVFADLMAAMWPIGLLKVARVIDNPFSVAKFRAEKVGEILAEILIKRAQGERPVTLIGYSLGARAIYVCLQTLAKRRAFNLVENAILIGAPTPSDTSDWRVLRAAVSGRLVNVYSTNDYILGFMYRTSAIQYGVAGLQAVEGLSGVENVDVSDDVDGHLRYRFLIGSILKRIGFADVDMQAVEEEQEALKQMIEEEKRNSLQAQRNRLVRQESFKKDGKVDDDAVAEAEASELEEEVKEKTQKSLVTKVIEWWYTPRAPNTKDAEKVVSNLQRALSNPSDVKAAASDTAQDIQNSTAGVAQRVYQALPNIPYMGSSGTTGGIAKGDPSKVANDVAEQAQSYTSRAAAYLPKSIPSMPSMPAMPSMPNIPGYSKQKEDTSSKPAKVTKDAGETAKNATNAATETVATTVKNVGNLNDNPATKQVREAPGIKQAVDNDPGVTQTLGKVTGALGTTVSNATDKATDATSTVTDKAGEAGSKGVEAVDAGTKKATDAGTVLVPIGKSGEKAKEQKQTQSYTGYAASYLPSMPSWGSKKSEGDSEKQQKKAAPKISRKSSARPAEPERKESSKDAALPKLARKESSNLGTGDTKSPAPKLGPRKASEPGTKTPLQRVSSGLKSAPGSENLPNLAETMPDTDSAKNAATAPQETVKRGSKAAGKAGKATAESGTAVLTESAKKGSDAVGQATPQGTKAVKKGSKTAGKAVSQGKSAAESGTAIASESAKKGTDAAGQVASQGKTALGQGGETAGQAVSQGTQAAESGATMISESAKKGTDAAGQVASQGKETVTSGANAATGAASSAFGGAKKFVGFGRRVV